MESTRHEGRRDDRKASKSGLRLALSYFLNVPWLAPRRHGFPAAATCRPAATRSLVNHVFAAPLTGRAAAAATHAKEVEDVGWASAAAGHALLDCLLTKLHAEEAGRITGYSAGSRSWEHE